MKINIEPIGVVRNDVKTAIRPSDIKEQMSIIEIDEKYIEGLKDVEKLEFIDVVFYFHLNSDAELIVNTPKFQNRGVFATRAPSRPNHIGVTTAKLLKVESNRLYVTRLDAIDGTPVLDLKCADTSILECDEVHNSILAKNPRIDIDRAIMSTNRESLLYKVGQMHGHICPGIAMGVLCGAEIMKMIQERGHDPYDYCMTAQQPNCVLDGIMFVTGFTPGKRKLSLVPGDNMSYRFANQEGKGWLVETGDSNREYMNSMINDDLPKFERALLVLGLDFYKVFDVTEL